MATRELKDKINQVLDNMPDDVLEEVFKYLKSLTNRSKDHNNFDTQFTISKFGRPDLALITDDTEILFEIKVYNTTLTENQPTGYYNYLKSESEAEIKGLILIIPENYYDIKRYNSNLIKIKKDKDGIYILRSFIGKKSPGLLQIIYP